MAQPEHYVVTVETGRLQIYTETRLPGELAARLVPVDLPAPVETEGAYRDRPLRPPPRGSAGRPGTAAFFAGKRFPSTPGASALRSVAEELDGFLANRPTASWDFAGSPAIYADLAEELSSSSLRRLKRVLAKLPRDDRDYADDVRTAVIRSE